MEFNFNSSLSNKSEAELTERIENRQKYMPETVQTAITELRQRGHLFTDEELKIYNEDIQAKIKNATLEKMTGGLFSKAYDYNIVEDPDAASLYSRRAVYIFSFFCTALFGSILLAINSRKIEKAKRGTIWILLYGVALTGLQITGGIYTKASSSFTVISCFVSAMSIDYFFWRPFIGNNTFYKARPIWTPLIIATVFLGLGVLAMFYGDR